MLDWGARIDDLADELTRVHRIEDRAGLEILLSALLPCPRTPSLWLVLETPFYSRECDHAWFSFGGRWEPCSLPRLRARYPWRDIEAETRRWMDECADLPRLFIECDYDRYPRYTFLTQAHYFLQRALRVRIPVARTAAALEALNQLDRERRQDQLAAATSYVLEDRAQARPAEPPRFHEPANFLYHLELVQRLSPWFRDWDTVVLAFGALAVRHAFLFGRPETSEEDYQALARVARDSIPPWIAKALRLLLDNPAKTEALHKVMGLEEWTRRSGHGAHRELDRLRRHQFVHWNKQAQHWMITDQHRAGIQAVLENRAFAS